MSLDLTPCLLLAAKGINKNLTLMFNKLFGKLNKAMYIYIIISGVIELAVKK